MPKGIYPRSRFCLRGHDTSICGRYALNRKCKECVKEHYHTPEYRKYGRIRARISREEGWAFIRKIKSNTPCKDCKNIYPPECMEFDHRPDEIKLFTISQNSRKTIEVLRKEMAKCDIICANCHRIRTFSREQQKFIKRID